MQIFKIYPVGFAANSYLVTKDGERALAIDPAQPRILREAEKRGLRVEYALLTHGHFDHIGGCAALSAAGARIGCLLREKPLALFRNLSEEFGAAAVPPFPIDFTAEDGETLALCGMNVRVMAAPGHTAGGACYLVENALFSGDTMFAGDMGRTDLPTGNASALRESLRRLLALGGDYTVYAGHGEDTTLSAERKFYGF